MEEIKVGDLLWYVNSRRGGRSEMRRVTKVGRKWIVIDGYPPERCDKHTLCVDAGKYSSYARCYRSREVYEAKVELDRTWDKFHKAISRLYSHPVGATVERIRQAAEAIGIDLEAQS